MFIKAREYTTIIIIIIIIICNKPTTVENKNKKKPDRSAPAGLTTRKQTFECTSMLFCTISIHPLSPFCLSCRK